MKEIRWKAVEWKITWSHMKNRIIVVKIVGSGRGRECEAESEDEGGYE